MAAVESRLLSLLHSCSHCLRHQHGSTLFLTPKLLTPSNVTFPASKCYARYIGRTICHYAHHRHPTSLKQIRLLLSQSTYNDKLNRCFFSHLPSSSSKPVSDPYKLVHNEMAMLCSNIRTELGAKQDDLGMITRYYFDGTGKAFRPLVVLLMAKACNIHHKAEDFLAESQKKIAMITEMLHTATLIHDDVIDASDTRRGKDSINYVWGQRKAILAGDYILSVVSSILARIGNAEVVSVMSQVVEDLVRGEFMQLGSKEDENERFAHYLNKTFKKTASMLAASCKSVAVLGHCSEEISNTVYQYGRNLGIAFQLVDDLLDFISSDLQLGKPTAADLRLGLATAPVLFAAQQFSELNPLIMRRFSKEGDVERARYFVAKSEGIEQTRILAAEHTKEAINHLRKLTSSLPQEALISLTLKLLQRKK